MTNTSSNDLTNINLITSNSVSRTLTTIADTYATLAKKNITVSDIINAILLDGLYEYVATGELSSNITNIIHSIAKTK